MSVAMRPSHRFLAVRSGLMMPKGMTSSLASRESVRLAALLFPGRRKRPLFFCAQEWGGGRSEVARQRRAWRRQQVHGRAAGSAEGAARLGWGERAGWVGG